MSRWPLLLLLQGFAAATTTDYCDPRLCRGEKHVACSGNNEQFDLICPKDARLIDLKPHIKYIVGIHNANRHYVATGSMKGLPPASRMATMKWDHELAALAKFIVRRCTLSHDDCHNTNSFRYSGQNVGYSGYKGRQNRFNERYLIDDVINNWWSEHKNTSMQHIKKFPSKMESADISHFTLMVVENNIRVGCAASRYFDGNYHDFLMACNYASNNFLDEPVYTAGITVSQCKTGRNSYYTSLCSSNEKYTGFN